MPLALHLLRTSSGSACCSSLQQAEPGALLLTHGQRFHSSTTSSSAYCFEQLTFTGESLDVKVLREGQLLDLKFQLKQRWPLVPILHGVDCVPSYFIVGGLVFVPLSIPFLEHAYGGMHTVQHAPCVQILCHCW